MRTRHERRHLLVAHLHIIDRVTRAIDRTDNAIDSVTGKSVDPTDSPLIDSFQQEIACVFTHDVNFELSLLLIGWKSHCAQEGVLSLARIESSVLDYDRYVRFNDAGIGSIAWDFLGFIEVVES